MMQSVAIDHISEDNLLFRTSGSTLAARSPAAHMADEDQIEGDAEDDEDDDIQDWSKLLISSSDKTAKQAKKSKRKLNKSGFKTDQVTGDKEFAPLNDEAYDCGNLSSARTVMYDTLGLTRGVQSTVDQINQNTIFYNSFSNKCYMYAPKGTFLKSMGRVDKLQRCWFEPEEALYLIERGSCIVKDDSGVVVSATNIEIDQEHPGFEMGLEEIYSLLIRNDDQYDNYCVYANLKRLGYIVMRTRSTLEFANEDDDNGKVQAKSDVEPDTMFGSSFKGRSYSSSLQNSFQMMSKDDYSRIRQKISQNMSILLLNNFKNLLIQPLAPMVRYIKGFLLKHQIISSSIFDPSHFNHTFYDSYKKLVRKIYFVKNRADIPATREEHLQSELHLLSSSDHPYGSFTFDVWKPVPSFSKRNPPIADFQVCVINVNKAKFPSFGDIKRLMGLSDNLSSSYKNSKTSLKNGYRNSLVAVVDQGVINYISLKEMDFEKEGSVYKESNNKNNPNNKNKSKSSAQQKKQPQTPEQRLTIAEEVIKYFTS